MYYIRLSDSKYPVTYSQLKQANPNTSIPKQPTDAQLLPLDHANVNPTQKPVDSNTYVTPDPLPPGYVAPPFYNANTHYIQEGEPYDNGSEYEQTWLSLLYSVGELDDNLQLAKDTRMDEINTQCNVNILKHWSM